MAENAESPGPLQPVDVERWKSQVRGKTLRVFIRYKMARQTAADRELAMQGMLQELPPEAHGAVVDRARSLETMAHTGEFWERDCADFYESIERAVRPRLEDRGIGPDDEDVFNAFEFICLALSRAVDNDPAIRGAARIEHVVRLGWLVVAAVVAVILYLILG
jgi:hypothetical protein